MIDIYTYPQRSVGWFKIRLGVISASCFGKVLAAGSGKTRHNYMVELYNELRTGIHKQGYQSPDMLRGTRREPDARKEYEFVTGNSVDEIGFAINNHSGCSPDGLVGADGGVEIKCVKPSVQARTVKANKMPPVHRPQVQGCMKVLNCAWWDFVSYSPDAKNYLFIKRIKRDEKYIKKLDNAIELFYSELIEMMDGKKGENNNG